MGVVTATRALLVLMTVGCQGQGREPARDPGGRPAAGPGGGAVVAENRDGPRAPVAPPLTTQQLLARLEAMPVWEGVVQRGQLLARRGERGVLYGRVGPLVGDGPLVWLIDDTEGEGCLGARAAFPGAAPPPGARIAATGAWVLPPEPGAGWVWQVERRTDLPADGSTSSRPEAESSSAIGHDPVVAARPPEAQPISKAKDNELVWFQVLAAPRRIGDGWLVADQLGSPAVAVLFLPGDRGSYGGIDFRQPDELWRLKRGVTYVAKIGRIRRKDPTKPAIINVRNAPIKVQ